MNKLTDGDLLSRELQKWKDKNLDYNKYFDKGYTWEQLAQIRYGLNDELNVSLYDSVDFSWMQMQSIRMGLLDNLDVSFYLDKRFTPYQMEQIRYGLKDNLDVSSYANFNLSWQEIVKERKRLLSEKFKNY